MLRCLSAGRAFQAPPGLDSRRRAARGMLSHLASGDLADIDVSDQADRRPPLPEDAALRAIVEGVEAETGDAVLLLARPPSRLGPRACSTPSSPSSRPDRQAFRTLRALGARRAPRQPDGAARRDPLRGGAERARCRTTRRTFRRFSRRTPGSSTGKPSATAACRSSTAPASSRGHLAIVDDKPMWDGPRGVAIMRIFAARARAEIERLRVRDAGPRNARRASATSTRRRRSPTISVGHRRAHPAVEPRVGRAARATPPRSWPAVPISTLWADTPSGIPRGEKALATLPGRRGDPRRGDRAAPQGRPAVWVRLSVRPIRDSTGRVEATRSTLIDVTALKRAEAALRASEERLARVLASAMDAIVTFDASRRIEIFNEAAEKIFHCRSSDVIGQPLDRFLTAELQQSLEASMRAFESGGQARPYVCAPQGLRARDADGREFPVEATISRVDVAGRPLYTLILRDVEERQRAEEELRELHQQNLYLQEEIQAVHNFDEIIGQSRALARRARARSTLVAPTDSTVLILGETGTGQGARSRAPSTRASAAQQAAHQGQLRGAADRARRERALRPREGRLHRRDRAPHRAASSSPHGGTIFLDEIGELPPEVQVEAAARAPGARVRARRRREDDPGRRARHRGHQPRPRSRPSRRARSARTSTTG